MIFEGSAVEDGSVLEADVCVVGSGAAGLTLAWNLAERGVDVLLVESGGLAFAKRSHDLLEVELTGRTDYPVLRTRERYFGGTTNHWGGVCRALDAFEFEPHEWVPHSGWPIRRTDLDPYYERAAALLGVSEVTPRYDPVARGVGDRERLVDAAAFGVESTVWRRVPDDHLRMGAWRMDGVRQSSRIRCLIDTTVAEVHVGDSRRHVEWLEGRTFGGRTFTLRARDFVLCSGAIENARLLLLSDSKVEGGLGNAHDLVGRFFMDHPGRVLGQVVVTGPSRDLYQEEAIFRDRGGSGPGQDLTGWFLTPAAREQHRLLGFMCFGFWRELDLAAEPERLPHAEAVRALDRGLRDGAEGAPEAVRMFELAVNWEQSPNPASRVALSNERDPLGIRRPTLHWAVRDDDLRSADRSAQLFAWAVAHTGRARVRLDDITGDRINNGGGHQMGTTRMADDPKQGVTDRDGRVHGLDNLFVGGSSLFPTSGWQHPTFTIVALALRQAEHLARRAKER